MKRGADAIIKPDADVMLRVFRRYDAAFGTLPPLNAWQGTDCVLLPLLDAAIREGRPLSEADFARGKCIGLPASTLSDDLKGF